MNWEAIGAVGEIIGAIAVVLSVVYLAVQVRQNTDAVRGNATVDALAGAREVNARLIDDPTINEIFIKGIAGMDNLTPAERNRFVALMFTLFKTFEQLHYQYKCGVLAPEIWAGWEAAFRAYSSSPGGQQYYRERKATLSADFQEWLETPSDGPAMKPLGQVGQLPTNDTTPA